MLDVAVASREAEKQVVMVAEYLATAWEALLTGRISCAIPLDVHISSAGTQIEYSLEGYTDFKTIMAESTPERVMELFVQLSDLVLECPLLMARGLRIFRPERLYYCREEGQWSALLLPTEGEDNSFMVLQPGQTLQKRTPSELWKELLHAAVEVNEAAEPLMSQALEYVQQMPFSVQELRLRLETGAFREEPEENTSAAEELKEATPAENEAFIEEKPTEDAAVPEAPKDTQEFPGAPTPSSEQPLPGDEPSESEDPEAETAQPVPEESAAGAKAAELEQEEHRPWEKGAMFARNAAVPPAGEPVKPAAPMPPVGMPPVTAPPVAVPPSVTPPPRKEPPAAGTTAPKTYNETVVLSCESEAPKKEPAPMRVPVETIRIPRVIRKRTKEMAYVDRAEFLIGTKPGAVDFLIRDNWTISRRHASIVTRNGKYFLMDLGATNGVIYKGRKLPKKTETPIEIGDVFTLANEEFTLEW